MRRRKTVLSTSPSAAIPGFAVAGADALLKLSEQFLLAVPADNRAAADFGMRNFGAMLASATNMLLAIELLLKALVLINGRLAPHTHELPALFSSLPDPVQRSLLAAYDAVTSEDPKSHRCLEIRPSDAPESIYSEQISDTSLKAVLQRNSNAYVHWRYAHSTVTNLGNIRLRYEFLDLWRVARSLRMHFIDLQLNEHLPTGEVVVHKDAAA